MSVISIIFLVLELVIIASSILIGCRRGTGRSLVRLLYLAVIGAVSFFVSRKIAFSVSPKLLSRLLPLLPQDAKDLLTASPHAVTILENMIGAMIAAFIISLIFILLQALSMVCFKLISSKISGAIFKDKEPKAGKWIGAAVGLVSGVLVSAFILTPIFTAVHTLDNVKSSTSEGILSLVAAPDKDTKLSNVFPLNKLVAKNVTKYPVPATADKEENSDSIIAALPILLDVTNDAFEVFTATLEYGGNNIDATSNAIAAAIPHIDRSVTLRRLAVEILSSMAKTLQDGGYVMGMHFVHSDNALIEDVIPSLLDAIYNTHDISVKENMITLFGDMNKTIILQKDGSVSVTGSYIDSLKLNAHSNGLIAAINELHHHDSEGMPDDNTLVAAELALALRHMSKNDNMDGVLNEVKQHITDPFTEKGIDIKDEKYTPIYDDIATSLTDVVTENIVNKEVDVDSLAEDLEEQLAPILDEYSLPLSDTETSIFATCAAKEFSDSKYLSDASVNITAEDIMAFFTSGQ